MIQTHKIVSKDQAQSLTNSLVGDTIKNKGIALEDNRPNALLQKKASTSITSRLPQAPIQRTVEEFRASGDKILFRSTYQTALNPENTELFETREEAQKVDDECKQIWEREQAEDIGGRAEKPKVSHKSMLSEASSSSSSSSKSLTAEKETVVSASPAKKGLENESKKAEDPNIIPIKKGLIHGSYTLNDNTADLHVESKNGGAGLAVKDMLAVATNLYDRMMETERITGIRGVFMLHPTGAAIVKIMVNLLGEALGSKWSKLRARIAKATRTAITGPKSPDKIHPNVLPEHLHYLEALRGENVVKISPQIKSINKKYRLKKEEYDQDKNGQFVAPNMMDGTEKGNAIFEKYKASEQDTKELTSAGLDITIFAEQLPAIIKILQSQLK